MITWNYRVFREDDGEYIIREVFYNEHGDIIGCTQDAVEPMGSSLEALTEDISSFQAALTLPVLTFADIPSESKEPVYRNRANNRRIEDLLEEIRMEPSVQKE